MNRFWSRSLEHIAPYAAGEQPPDNTFIKLNTNENPYPPSPLVLERLRSSGAELLRRYPDPEAQILKRALAQALDVGTDMIHTGNGSDEVLAMAFMAFFRQDRPICFPDITYSFYPVWCSHYGIRHTTAPVTERYEIDPALFPTGAGGIVFANPNAPTGAYLPQDSIRTLLERCTGCVIVVDEAYVDFGAESCIPLTLEYPHLLVVQTMSKSRSLAGLRVGYAVGDPGLIEGLRIAKNSFNSYPLDAFAIVGAVAALEDRDYYDQCRRQVMETREWTADRLRDLGFEVIPSLANFLMVKHPRADAGDLYRTLREQGVLVRWFRLPRIEDYLRISIGTREQMEVLVERLRPLLG